MKVIGINSVNNFLDNYLKKVEKAASDGLEKGAEYLLEKSKELTPKDSGRLINETAVVKKDKLHYEVEYTAPYSVYVHEDLSKKYKSGQAKFLEKATNKNGKKIIKYISKKIGGV